MTFGKAIQLLGSYRKMKRSDWGDDYIWMRKPIDDKGVLHMEWTDETPGYCIWLTYGRYGQMFTEPWSAMHSDYFAIDWMQEGAIVCLDDREYELLSNAVYKLEKAKKHIHGLYKQSNREYDIEPETDRKGGRILAILDDSVVTTALEYNGDMFDGMEERQAYSKKELGLIYG